MKKCVRFAVSVGDVESWIRMQRYDILEAVSRHFSTHIASPQVCDGFKSSSIALHLFVKVD